jgi:conjugal transfer pilus assembly protein TraV
MLGGCSVFNPVGDSDFGCPGMPNTIVCKTPAAVYNSTNGDLAKTEFDTPISADNSRPIDPESLDYPTDYSSGSTGQGSRGSGQAAQLTFTKPATTVIGPRPVREPARIARIKIFPWIDKDDNLHLSQVIYTEIKPRTWTLGKPEQGANNSGAGSLVPHRLISEKTGPSNTKTAPVSSAPATEKE